MWNATWVRRWRTWALAWIRWTLISYTGEAVNLPTYRPTMSVTTQTGVVLGKWLGQEDGCIGEARGHGGIYVFQSKILKDKSPIDFPTTNQFLESVRNRIEKYFPIAHAAILEM